MLFPFLAPCGDRGGVVLGSQCLLLNTDKQTWDGAVSACNNSGHQLASIVDLQGLVDYLIEDGGKLLHEITCCEQTFLFITMMILKSNMKY